MKKLIFLVLLTTCSIFTHAQHVVQRDSMPVVGIIKFSLFDSSSILNKTTQGIIYKLPLDNMPVLKPDKRFTSNMPVYTQNPLFAQTNPVIIPDYRKNIQPGRRHFNPLTKPKPKENLRFETPAGKRGINIL